MIDKEVLLTEQDNKEAPDAQGSHEVQKSEVAPTADITYVESIKESMSQVQQEDKMVNMAELMQELNKLDRGRIQNNYEKKMLESLSDSNFTVRIMKSYECTGL